MIPLDVLASPIGPLTAAERDGRVCLLWFDANADSAQRALGRWYPGERIASGKCVHASAALRRYFDGELTALDGVDVEMNGTPFQKSVWAALRKVRPGKTATYSEIARRIGTPAAIRAVGAANGANPVAVIVPCHRVIGADGTLTGYGGGLERKRWLLAHEAHKLF